MMKTLSFKITTNHFLLCVTLSLLWVVHETQAQDTTPTSAGTSGTEATMTTAPFTTPMTTALTTQPPLPNPEEFIQIGQTETSINLQWKKVDGIFNYTLEFIGGQKNVPAQEEDLVTYNISNLISTTEYNITLYSVRGDDKSTGVNLTAYTAPPNAVEFKQVDQNETSITLQWEKVESEKVLNYRLEFSGRVVEVPSTGEDPVKQTISDLTNTTQYQFTLFSVYGNINSSGVKTTAYTAPPNAEGFTSVDQNETSITLQWEKVNKVSIYKLVFNENKIDITALGQDPVKYTVSDLTDKTQYNFTLFSVYENVNSSGAKTTAYTAPLNTEDFRSVGETETSITLQWTKVDDVSSYILEFIGGKKNFTASGNDLEIHKIPDLTNTTQYNFTLYSLFHDVRSSGVNTTAYTAPPNAEGFQKVDQNETSITLQWEKVDNVLDYRLEFGGRVEDVPTSGEDLVKHTISKLTNTTQYQFTLFSVYENVNSSGVKTTAYTAPLVTKYFTSVDQNETSITLQWEKVDDILNYALEVNEKLIPINVSEGQQNPTYTIFNLTSGTKYDFTLYSLFHDVRSSGVELSAATAPRNTDELKSVDQNETSITLQWRKVERVLSYKLVFNENEKNITASVDLQNPTYTVLDLLSGTKYNFTLYSVFENVQSSGVKLSAPTAPRNTEELKSVDQNETSITLQWKKVERVLNYKLVFNENEINVTASEDLQNLTYTVLDLTSGTKYNFTLYSLFENVQSSGVKLSAPTAPRNTEELKSVDQNETSITLQWRKVERVLNYKLVFNENEKNVTASEDLQNLTYTVLDLTSGTKYNFTLYSLFENVQSSGVKLSAPTAPRNTEELKSVDQNETSITLQWRKVERVLNYKLVFNENEKNVTASEDLQNLTYTVLDLTSGTKYNFTLYSLFENVQSSGVKLSAPTAPRNTEELKSVDQNETSITLQWKKVERVINYKLVFNEKEINVTASEDLQNLTYTVLDLISGTKYNFILYSLFENVQSSGVKLSAPTAPGNVNNVTVLKQNESSITLMWEKVNNISTYFLQYDNKGSPIKVMGDKFYNESSVTHVVSLLNAGTSYSFTLITLFEKVSSTGFSFNAVTVPPVVSLVHVPVRSVTSITLMWEDVNSDWDYLFQINGGIVQHQPKRTKGDVSYSVTSLHPGTEYHFNVTTVFSGLKSTAYKNFTVTKIDCSSATWHVTTSSIHGIIEGLFSTARVTNASHSVVSLEEGGNVSFTGLYPGATYEVSLEYEREFRIFPQCTKAVSLTTMPPYVTAKCEYWGAGYSVLVVWDKPDGIWTLVEVNVSEESYKVYPPDEHLQISGFLPARTYQVSLVALSGTVRNSKPTVFSCFTDPRGVIAGSVCAVLLFVLLVLAVLLFLKRPDIISRKKPFISGSRQSKNKCKAISVAKFPAHFHQLGADENRGFTEEYESLASVGTEQTRKAATLPENKARNRFNNVLPYDWCRVKLTTSSSDGASDYINASYMPGYNSSREYIATQGPLPTTVNDFWRMIWEQKVKGIVMVTNCTEGGRVKCEQYWPANSKPCTHGELVVTLRSEQVEPDWTLREFSVKHRNFSGERTVKHFHFTAWPDHGVPQGTQVLIQFRGLVRRHINTEGEGAPTVVHCSAGVGRTGTIISLDVLLQQLERERAVGIKGFVHKMRLSRPYMVQTESQYVFLHQCMMDCLQQNDKAEENIYENADMIYANATALREFHNTNT